jgi:Secretion system C-terminal sorting domain
MLPNKLYLSFLCLFFNLMTNAQSIEKIGNPTIGSKGITVPISLLESKSILVDKEPKVNKLLPELEIDRNAKRNSKSINSSAYPIKNEVNRIGGVESITGTQTIVSNFLGITLSETQLTPADGIGDIGTTQICVTTNGRIKFYEKNTICQPAITTLLGNSSIPLNNPQYNINLNTFFESVKRTGSSISDPHVRFDRNTNRWFIVAIDIEFSFSPNRCLIAVSNNATINSLSSFTFFYFNFNELLPIPNNAANGFFDYPTLGMDINALYIGGVYFNAGGNAYIGSSVFVIKKSSILGAGPITTTAFHFIGNSTSGIYVPQPADNDDPNASIGYIIGVDKNILGNLILHSISNAGTTPVLSAPINLAVPSTSIPIKQVSKGTSQTLDAIDDRLFSAMIRKNKITGVSSLWTSHTNLVNDLGVSTALGTRNAVRWYQIDNLSTTPTLLQAGTVYDPTNTNPSGYLFPSIASNGQGHALIGFCTAGNNDYVNAGIVGRYRTDPLGTQQSPNLSTAASTVYAPQYNPFNNSLNNRWGDYSQTVVDPVDDMTMWTFQEYCSSTNQWGVRVIQAKAPAPATPLLLGTIACGSVSILGSRTTNVILNGISENNSEFFDPGQGYNRLTITSTGSGVSISNINFISPLQVNFKLTWPTSLEGTSQTLTITNPDCQSINTVYTLPTLCAALPVNYINFSGKKVNKTVLLDWSTENEIDNDFFLVEKSNDQINFTEIGKIKSSGVVNGFYQFFDNNPSKINYYRLKQVDINGGFKYSKIIIVEYENNNDLLFIYPNPAFSTITIEHGFVNKNYTIKIIDATGKTVIAKKIIDNIKSTIDISTLAEGLYVVSLSDYKKSILLQEKLIVKRK